MLFTVTSSISGPSQMLLSLHTALLPNASAMTIAKLWFVVIYFITHITVISWKKILLEKMIAMIHLPKSTLFNLDHCHIENTVETSKKNWHSQFGQLCSVQIIWLQNESHFLCICSYSPREKKLNLITIYTGAKYKSIRKEKSMEGNHT